MTTVIDGTTGVNRVQDGVVVESGSNANGEWTKFADGTLICRKVDFNLPSASHAIIASGFYLSANWTFPLVFITAPQVMTQSKQWPLSADSPVSTEYYRVALCRASQVTTTTTSIAQWFNGVTVAGKSWNVDLLAIGRWK